MEDAHAPHFFPWIGSAYETGVTGGLKLLILGESHYGNPHDKERYLTQSVVENQLSGAARQGFLTRVQRLVSEATDRDSVVPTETPFWHRVAFYNYVQELVGETARIRPSVGAWERSASAFVRQLEILQPHAVLVCGRALWDQLKSVDGLTDGPEINSTKPDVRSRTLHISGRTVGVAAPINHPASRGFKRERWLPVVDHLLSRADRLRSRLI